MATVMTAPPSTIRVPSDRVFYVGMGIIALAIVFWGFSATFFLRPASDSPLPMLRVVHGAVFTSWFVLFIIQTSLVAADRRDLHRRLGVVTVAVAVLMVVLGTITAVDALRRHSIPVPGIDPRSFFAVPIFDMVVFATLVASAVHFRRQLETHKRLMLLACIGILTAAIARIPLPTLKAGGLLAFFAVDDLLVLMGPLYDYVTRRRVHRAYIWGAALIVVSQPARLAISGTAPWLSFAELFLR